MKKIILLILILLLIPFFIITIKDMDREEVNPTLTYNLTTTDSTYTDLNDHTLQEVFESTIPALTNLVTNGDFSDGTTNWASKDGNSFTINNNVLEYTFTTTLQLVGVAYLSTGFPALVTNTDVIYYHLEIKGDKTSVFRIGVGNSFPYNDNITTSWTIKTGGIQSVSNSLLFLMTNANNVLALNDKIYLKNVHLFNLTASHGVTATSGSAYDNAVAEIEWILSKNDGYIQSVGNPFEIVDLTVEEMDAWYTIYQTYHTTYTTLTLGTATATTYVSLQQLILDNDDKDFKLYRDDVVDETHYRLTQETGYISITNDADLEIMRINDDDTFESSLQIDDTLDYKLVGYNVTSYIDGSFDNTILAFVWIIPILLIGGFFFVIFSHRKED